MRRCRLCGRWLSHWLCRCLALQQAALPASLKMMLSQTGVLSPAMLGCRRKKTSRLSKFLFVFDCLCNQLPQLAREDAIWTNKQHDAAGSLHFSKQPNSSQAAPVLG